MFLETLAMNATSGGSSSLSGAGLLAMTAGLSIFVGFLIAIGLYVYTSFAYMGIAKKAKQPYPGLAWIPFIGPAIVSYNSSKMHWWPWLLLVVGFFSIMPIISDVVVQIANLAFFVFFVIWRWKLMEEIKKPGWWSLLMIIPVVNLIMMGIAAWSKD